MTDANGLMGTARQNSMAQISTATATQAEMPVIDSLRMQNQNFVNSMLNKNTMRGLKGAAAKFQNFLDKKNEGTNMLNLEENLLDQYIAGWLLDMRKSDGSQYEPNTLSTYLQNLARHFSVNGSKLDIIHDKKSFGMTHKVLSSKKRDLKRQGLGNLKYRATMIEAEDEELLWERGSLGSDNPETLIHTVWYLTTKMLGFRGSHEARQLRFGDFKLVKENDEMYVEWNERETKTRHGENSNSVGQARHFAPKLWPNKSDPSRCPIKIYEKYISKRPASMLLPESPFYLAVNYTRPNELSVWFKKSPMGF